MECEALLFGGKFSTFRTILLRLQGQAAREDLCGVTVLRSLEMSENHLPNNAGSHFVRTSTFTVLPALLAVFAI
jgi:hypothetical protein